MRKSKLAIAFATAGISAGVAPLYAADEDTQIVEIRVVSQRGAIDDAMNRYRNADGISNFVAADDMGQFVDQNVAENLQRIPGIAITRDQGEGRFVSVRGVGASMSNVTINGMRIGTPESDNRSVPLDIIPSGSVNLLEINKVPTPDKPGDAVGGTVDINSGSPFSRSNEEGNFDYRTEMTYNDLGDETNPTLGLNYSNVFGIGGSSDNLGISVGVNYQQREIQSDNVETEYDYLEVDGQEVLAPIETQLRKYFVDRERLGANMNVEYRHDHNNHYFFDALFSRFDDAEVRQRSIFVFEDGDLSGVGNGQARFEDIDEDGFRRRIRNRTKEQDTIALAFRGEHIMNDWEIDYQVGHSITREEVPDEYEGRFEKTGDPLDALVHFGHGRTRVDILRNGAVDLTYLDNANYVLDRVVEEPIKVDDDDSNLSLNFQRNSAFGIDGLSMKFGFDGRFKRKDTDVNEAEFRDVPGLSLADFTSSAPSYGLDNDLGPGISAPNFFDYFFSNRDQFRERPQDMDENRQLRQSQDFRAEEDVYAGYLMGTYQTGPWQFIAGGRFEHTEYSADGNEIDIAEDGTVLLRPRSVKNDYSNFLPAFHARYDINDDMVLRGAWTNTISRPSFGDISPRFEIDRDEREIDTGNPNLDPFESTNLDLLFDWYPGESTVISLGVFHKDIDNFTTDFRTRADGPFEGYYLTRPINSEDASILGFEANIEMDLAMLNESLAGFLIGANTTFLDTDFEVAERAGDSLRLPGSVHETANLYVGYESGRLSTRLSYSQRGKFLDDIGASSEFDIWVAESQQLDLVLSYRLSPAVNLRLEAGNLLDDPLELYQGHKGNNYQFEEYGRTLSLGLTGRF